MLISSTQFLPENFKNQKCSTKIPEILDLSWFKQTPHRRMRFCQASRWPEPSTLSFFQTWRRNTDPTWMESGRPQRRPPKNNPGHTRNGSSNNGSWRNKCSWFCSRVYMPVLQSWPRDNNVASIEVYQQGKIEWGNHTCKAKPRQTGFVSISIVKPAASDGIIIRIIKYLDVIYVRVSSA